MKKLGFGFMRLPLLPKEGEGPAPIDLEQCKKMVDLFMAEGFCYFDTAKGYLDGRSEGALRECLTDRYPRESYILADKLTAALFKTEEDIRPYFENQLQTLGVTYFDNYLLHAVTDATHKKYERCHAYEILKELKAEGKIRRLGMSYHDSAAFLDKFLAEHPEIEFVQIQLNYADWDDASIQSGDVYEVCVKYNKPVIVMEPCKGGNLINLPPEAAAIFEKLGGSPASYAIRYAASHPQVEMVLSGMSNLEQLTDNIGFMKDFEPLNAAEQAAVEKVRQILKDQHGIKCTACRYCEPGCPKNIPIPDLFACYNKKQLFKDWNADFYYGISIRHRGKASDCIACGKCEEACPQHLPVRELLKDVAAIFEPKQEG